MEKDVLITIKSLQETEGERAEPTELISQGRYVCLGDMQKFSYMESALTGMEGTCTAFTVTVGEALMERSGSLTSSMHFLPGRKNRFLYNTPYGHLYMGLTTHKLESHLGEKGGELHIEYELDLEGALLSRNSISISIKVKEEWI